MGYPWTVTEKKRASAMARRHRAESRSSISSHGELFGGFHGDLMGINGIFHGIRSYKQLDVVHGCV
jgi:hypothetical protein